MSSTSSSHGLSASVSASASASGHLSATPTISKQTSSSSHFNHNHARGHARIHSLSISLGRSHSHSHHHGIFSRTKDVKAALQIGLNAGRRHLHETAPGRAFPSTPFSPALGGHGPKTTQNIDFSVGASGIGRASTVGRIGRASTIRRVPVASDVSAPILSTPAPVDIVKANAGVKVQAIVDVRTNIALIHTPTSMSIPTSTIQPMSKVPERRQTLRHRKRVSFPAELSASALGPEGSPASVSVRAASTSALLTVGRLVNQDEPHEERRAQKKMDEREEQEELSALDSGIGLTGIQAPGFAGIDPIEPTCSVPVVEPPNLVNTIGEIDFSSAERTMAWVRTRSTRSSGRSASGSSSLSSISPTLLNEGLVEVQIPAVSFFYLLSTLEYDSYTVSSRLCPSIKMKTPGSSQPPSQNCGSQRFEIRNPSASRSRKAGITRSRMYGRTTT
jgi:hypothetical protein